MSETGYRQSDRRLAMLRAVHKWCEDRPAYDDMLWETNIATLVQGGDYVTYTENPDKQSEMKYQAEQINLFLTLVRERLIDATIVADKPVIQVRVRGLHARGLAMIGELPDPQQALADALETMSEAIQNMQGISKEERNAKEKAVKELGGFVRNAAPQTTAEILGAFGRSLIGL